MNKAILQSVWLLHHAVPVEQYGAPVFYALRTCDIHAISKKLIVTKICAQNDMSLPTCLVDLLITDPIQLIRYHLQIWKLDSRYCTEQQLSPKVAVNGTIIVRLYSHSVLAMEARFLAASIAFVKTCTGVIKDT